VAAKPLGIDELKKLKDLYDKSGTKRHRHLYGTLPSLPPQSARACPRLGQTTIPLVLAQKYRDLQLGSSDIGGSVKVVSVSRAAWVCDAPSNSRSLWARAVCWCAFSKNATNVTCMDGTNRLAFPIALDTLKP